MRFLAALSFLTVLRVPFTRKATPEEVGGSTRYFPLVGLLVGGVLAGLSWLFGLALPPAVGSALLLAALVAITGAIHLDGFVDTCDGLAGHRSVEERWAAMRDSRAGAVGIVGVVLLLLAKYAALNAVPQGVLAPALVLMVVTGRWAMVYAVFAHPYARPSGLGKVFKQETRWPNFVLATVFTLAAATAAAWWADLDRFYLAGPSVMLIVLLVVALVAAYLRRRFAGLTGDAYGFINEAAELGVLLLVVMAAESGWL